MRTDHRFPALWLALAAPAVLGLSACSTVPDYQPPAVEVPAQFKQAQPAPPGSEAAAWKPADPAAADLPDAWWRLFGDPVLDALQDQLLSGNEDLKISAARVRQAQAALADSRAGLFPTLNLGLSGTRAASPAGSLSAGSTVSVGGEARNTVSLSGNASWEIDLWGRVAGSVDAAGARLQASRADQAAARLSAQATLAQTYFEIRATEAQQALLERSVAAYQRSLELTRNRYQAGVASAADVAQAQGQLKSTEAQRVEAGISRSRLENALAVLLGRAPAAFTLAAGPGLPALPPVPRQLPAQLLERRPDIAAAERRVAAAHAQIGVANAAWFPALTLSAGAGFRDSALAGLIATPNRFWSIGPALALSLLDGGARGAAVDGARASADEATASYRQTVLTALQEVEDNLVLAARLEEQARLQDEALAAARRTLEIVSHQYRAGTVSYLNVVSAQAGALSAERSQIELRSRQLAAVNQLLKNIAGRWQTPPS